MTVPAQGFDSRFEPTVQSSRLIPPAIDDIEGLSEADPDRWNPELDDRFDADGQPMGPGQGDGRGGGFDDDPGAQQSWVRLVVSLALIVTAGALVLVVIGFGDDGAQDLETPESTPTPTADDGTANAAPLLGEEDPGTAASGLLDSREAPFVDTDPTTFWVDPSAGNEENDGQTPEAPWASLQGALDRVEPGQTIFLMTGDYTETRERVAHYVVERGGTPDAWVKVTAGPGHSPVIAATTGNGISVRADYVEVSGLEVRGRGFDAGNPYGWGLLVRNAHHVRLEGNTVSGMPVGGLGSIEASNLAFVGNDVFDNSFWGTEQGSGISIWHAQDMGTEPYENGYHNVITDNVIYRNENKVPSRFRDGAVITDGNGIIIDQNDETGYTGRTLVANNVIFDNGGRAVLVLESSRVDVFHNTTYQNGRTESLEGGPVELAAGRANDVRFHNNLVWSRPGEPALLYNTSADIVTGGNLLISTNQGPYTIETDVIIGDDAGLVAPGLDPAVADFRPKPGGRAAEVGIDLGGALPTDGNGVPRSGRGSVGALEPALAEAVTSDG